VERVNVRENTNADERVVTNIQSVRDHPNDDEAANVGVVANVEKHVAAENPIERNESKIIYYILYVGCFFICNYHSFVWIYILNNYFRNKHIAYKEELAVV